MSVVEAFFRYYPCSRPIFSVTMDNLFYSEERTEMGNIGVTELLLILVIVFLVFGSKKLSTLGKDLGGAIRDFRKSMREEETAPPPPSTSSADAQTRPAPDTHAREAAPPDKAAG
jgi:sec-independent protein translocase protein TatA